MIKEENMYKIYVHINKSNGKLYIGQTKTSLKKRWRNGFGYKESKYFWNAIQKYGWDGFEHLLLIDGLSLEEANICEEFLIKKYNTTNRMFGYNIYFGGDNYIKPLETRIKLAQYKYYGVDNPNYKHYWTDKIKNSLREKQKKNSLYNNETNPNAKKLFALRLVKFLNV